MLVGLPALKANKQLILWRAAVLPRKSRLRITMEKYADQVKRRIIEGDVIDATGIFDPIPPREHVRTELAKPPINVLDRTFRVIKVEDLDDYKIFIQIPGEKTEYDFFVWRAVFDDNNVVDLKIPSHDDLGRMYLGLKRKHEVLDEYLINATLRFIRDRWRLNDVIERYFSGLSEDLVSHVKRFLLTLKWIAIQEDANYPPPNLGSVYSLSVYAILEITGDLAAIRKIIRFGGR